jgi:hypothetical protein
MGNNNKSDFEYLFNHGQVNNYAVDDVLNHRPSELRCSTGMKLIRDVTMRPLVILKQLQSSMDVMGEN